MTTSSLCSPEKLKERRGGMAGTLDISPQNSLRVASFLSLARRAGVLFLGQDDIRRALRRGDRILVLLTSDSSANVQRALKGYVARGMCRQLFLAATREEMHGMTGLGLTQVFGLPETHGLARKIEEFAAKGGERNE
jgi:hypothetical protein